MSDHWVLLPNEPLGQLAAQGRLRYVKKTLQEHGAFIRENWVPMIEAAVERSSFLITDLALLDCFSEGLYWDEGRKQLLQAPTPNLSIDGPLGKEQGASLRELFTAEGEALIPREHFQETQRIVTSGVEAVLDSVQKEMGLMKSTAKDGRNALAPPPMDSPERGMYQESLEVRAVRLGLFTADRRAVAFDSDKRRIPPPPPTNDTDLLRMVRGMVLERRQATGNLVERKPQAKPVTQQAFSPLEALDPRALRLGQFLVVILAALRRASASGIDLAVYSLGGTNFPIGLDHARLQRALGEKDREYLMGQVEEYVSRRASIIRNAAEEELAGLDNIGVLLETYSRSSLQLLDDEEAFSHYLALGAGLELPATRNTSGEKFPFELTPAQLDRLAGVLDSVAKGAFDRHALGDITEEFGYSDEMAEGVISWFSGDRNDGHVRSRKKLERFVAEAKAGKKKLLFVHEEE